MKNLIQFTFELEKYYRRGLSSENIVIFLLSI